MKYRKWTEEEDRILEECCMLCDRPIDEAVRRLDRSKDAIRLRAYTLGVSAVCEKTRDLYAEWVLFNEIRNMLRKLKGEAPVPFSENPFEG